MHKIYDSASQGTVVQNNNTLGTVSWELHVDDGGRVDLGVYARSTNDDIQPLAVAFAAAQSFRTQLLAANGVADTVSNITTTGGGGLGVTFHCPQAIDEANEAAFLESMSAIFGQLIARW